MNRTLFSLAVVISTVALLVGLQTASAEFIGDTKDSANFLWNYEMDVDPSTQDLDGYSGRDWNGDLRGSITVNGDGTVTLDGPDGNGAYAVLSSAGSSETRTWKEPGHVWQNITDDTGFTVELRVKCVGGLYVVAMDEATNNSAPLVIDDYSTRHNTTEISDEANNDDFHVFRIAQLPDEVALYIWRDDELLVDGSISCSSIVDWTCLQIGDMRSPDYIGPNVVDYVRLTTGAYAPIPEPSTLALLATGLIGLLAYAWRKRK